MPRYVHLYFMGGEPERVRDAAARHTAYWHALGLAAYAGGPFADRTGGLITFVADDEEAARAAVNDDPFVREGLLSQSWLKRWQPIGAAESLAPDLQTSSR